MTSTKMSSVPSWHQCTAEKRPLKKHKLGPPDVYPLDGKTEDENLSTNRILKGWHFPASNFEHESLVFHGREAKLNKVNDCLFRAANVMCGSFNKKFDYNATLDKDRRKMGKETANAHLALLQGGATKAKDRATFFTDLARGKPLAQLAKKIPVFNKRKEEILDYLCDYKIPAYRALWFMKISATFFLAQANKSSKKTPDSYEKDYRTMFNTEIVELMRKMWSIDDLTASTVYKDRWHYVTTLARRAFDDGVIEKQEFLNELCEAFCDFYLTRKTVLQSTTRDWRDIASEEKPALLRVFLLMFSQYIRFINLNMILARRTAHMFAMKLRTMLIDYQQRNPGEDFYQTIQEESESGDEKKKPVVINSFHKMAACKAHRSSIYMMSAMLHHIVIDAPASVIWNNYKVELKRKPFIISQLCSSPLDLLPCPFYELPLPPGTDSTPFVELLKLRHTEIMRRSQGVQDRWSDNQKEQALYAKKIEQCLDVVGILDSGNIFDPEYIPKLAAKLITFEPETPRMEILLRFRLIFQWAVTVEREGSYRQCVIPKLLQYQITSQGHYYFGGIHVQDVILDYFRYESPRPGSLYYGAEFGNMMTLFLELIRQELFDHDWFVKYMIRNNEHDFNIPVMYRFQKREQSSISESDKGDPESSGSTVENGAPMPKENGGAVEQRPAGIIIPPVEREDEHILTTDDMWFKHRILIQIPLPQTETYRDEANQREMVVHGTGETAESHKNDLKKIAREICKIWQKKIYIKFIKYKGEAERIWCPKRYTAKLFQETLSKFRTQTYYDQVVICGWCSESFVDMIHDFINGKSLQMPTADGLDILLGMLEESQYIFGIFEICEAILPMLPMVEKVIRSFAADCIPGTMACQMGYVFVSFLSKHWHYFLHSGRAPIICNLLYELIERMIRAQDFPATCWGRVIAAFVYHTKKQLKRSKLTNDIKIRGAHAEFRNVFNHGSPNPSMPTPGLKYNSLFCRDVLEATSQELRYCSYHKYKKRLPSFGIISNRYSFVINSFIAAKNCGRDFDRLCDLSAFCGHITAQIPVLADDWILAVRALCLKCPNTFTVLTSQLNINDCSIHYPLATFVMLLAGKYAFSVQRLIADILANVFPVMWKNYYQDRSGSELEPGVCLALHILSKISCGSEEPFEMTPHYNGLEEKTKLVPSTADETVLSMIHWCEMDNALFPLLCNIGILQDSLKGRHKDYDVRLPSEVMNTGYRKEYLTNVVRASLSTICEQDWVTMKMFDIVQSNNMEAFNHDRLKQNGLGQQLLRLGIRRRCEKDVLRDLTVCNANSKKALIDKLLFSMNLWNMRATLFDLMLMIKEISPEGSRAHQSATAAEALLSEIGRSCRDLFTLAYKEGVKLPSAILDDDFHIDDITNYWLIASLIRMCPRPANLPPNYGGGSVAGKFLGEAARLLDTANDSSKERIHQSTWLLSQQSFLNLIMVCMKAEKKTPGKGPKELLVDSLYKQLLEITVKTKGNPALPHMAKFSADKEGVFLRLSLVGGIFDQICKEGVCDIWAILLFQIMLHGVITPDKDNRSRILFDSCYDMLSTLMLWTLVEKNNQVTLEGGEKYRWSQYAAIIKKLKREVSETRISGDLRHLYQFLPIPKNTFDVIAMEPSGMVHHSPVGKMNRHAPIPHNHGIRHGRLALQPQDKLKSNTYDFIHGYVPDSASPKPGWKWSMFQAIKVDKQPVPIQKFIARMSLHKHPYEFPRPALIWMDSTQDQFLTPPVVEPTEVTPTSSPVSSSTTTTTTTATTTTTTTTNGTTTTSTINSPASVEVASPSSALRPDSRPSSKEISEDIVETKPNGVVPQDTPPTISTVTTPTSVPTSQPAVSAPQVSTVKNEVIIVNSTEPIRPPSSGRGSASESPRKEKEKSRKRPGTLQRQSSQAKQPRRGILAPSDKPLPPIIPPVFHFHSHPPLPPGYVPPSSQPGPTPSNPPPAPVPPKSQNPPVADANANQAGRGPEDVREKMHDMIIKRIEARNEASATGMGGPANPPPNHSMPPSGAHNDYGRGNMPGDNSDSAPSGSYGGPPAQQAPAPSMHRPIPPQTNVPTSQGSMPSTMPSQRPPQPTMPSHQQGPHHPGPMNPPNISSHTNMENQHSSSRAPQHQPPMQNQQQPTQGQHPPAMSGMHPPTMKPPQHPSMQGQQGQHQSAAQGQSHLSMQGQHGQPPQHHHPSMPNQPTAQQQQPPMSRQHPPAMSSQHHPPPQGSGQHISSMPSQHQSSMSGQHQPSMSNQSHPSMQSQLQQQQSQHQQSMQNQHQTTMQNQNHPPSQSQHQAQMQSQHQQSMQNQHQPSMQSQYQTSLQSQHQQPMQNQHPSTMQREHQQPMQSQHPQSMQSQHPSTMQSQHQHPMQSQHSQGMQNPHPTAGPGQHQQMQNPHPSAGPGQHQQMQNPHPTAGPGQHPPSMQQHQPPMQNQNQPSMSNQQMQSQAHSQSQHQTNPMHQQHPMQGHQPPPHQQSQMHPSGPQSGPSYNMGMPGRNPMGQFSTSRDDRTMGMPTSHSQQQQHPGAMGMQNRGPSDVKSMGGHGPPPMAPGQPQQPMSGPSYNAPQQNQSQPMGAPMNPPMRPSMPTQQMPPQQSMQSQQMSQPPMQSQPPKPPGMNPPGGMGGQHGGHGMSMQQNTYGQQPGMSSQGQGMQPPMQRPSMNQPMMGGPTHMGMGGHGGHQQQPSGPSGYSHHQQPHGMSSAPQPHMSMSSGMPSMSSQHSMGGGSQMPSHMNTMSNPTHQAPSYMGGQDSKHLGQPPMGSGPPMGSNQNMMNKPMMGGPPQMGAPSMSGPSGYSGPSAPSYSHNQHGYQTGSQMGSSQSYGAPMGQPSYSSNMGHGSGPPMSSRMHPNSMMGGPNPMGAPTMSGPSMGGPPMGGPSMGGPSMGGPGMGGQQMGGPGMGMNPQYGHNQQQYMMNDQRMMQSQQQQYGHQGHPYGHQGQPPQY